MGFAQRSFVARRSGRLMPVLVGIGVIFACLGLGEAVYRFIFLDFDGATDRLPIELLFGIAFAWTATKLVKSIYQNRIERSAKISMIRDRNHKIRHAVQAIEPVSYPNNHQAIRVIREEVDRIEGTLTEIIAR